MVVEILLWHHILELSQVLLATQWIRCVLVALVEEDSQVCKLDPITACSNQAVI